MRSASGWREICAGAFFPAALAGATGSVQAAPQATCEDGGVVKPDAG